MTISQPISEVSRILKTYAARLEKLGIHTVEDLLYHLPSRYEDFSLTLPIGSVQEGETVTLKGKIVEAKNQYIRGGKSIQKVLIGDETGTITASWFNQPYIVRNLHPGDMFAMAGLVSAFGTKKQMQNPEYEVLKENHDGYHTGKIIPIYPATKGVSAKFLRKQIGMLLEQFPHLPELLPEEVLQQEKLLPLSLALMHIHFPKNFTEVQSGRARLAYEELFLFALATMERRKAWDSEGEGLMFINHKQEEFEKFLTSLPFTLTHAQEKAIAQMLTDFQSGKAMNRLLQGDVGSGKTIVATAGMYLAYLNGYQSVLLAPTEILATQHFATVSKLLEPFGVKVQLITGSTKHESRNKKTHDSSLMIHDSNPPDILIGTHALLNEAITFTSLGLVVIDEQQRFGVRQRAVLREKGDNPHLLTMTATPIPRTIALTMYGDLDVSYLNEMPKGRKVIKTWLVPEEKRESSYDWMRKEILGTDSQVFIICPLIEESENMVTVKAATQEFEYLQKEIFPDLKLALLHGRQKAKEKDEILKDFKDKKYHILIATPVVEVGIDIPNATVIVIEASERFGLSQLHQLRGRVGRGDKQSYCLLFTNSKNPQTKERLKALETTNSGSDLAELDLKLRGAGDMYGTAQHGATSFRFASFSDTDLIARAQAAARNLFPRLHTYPLLQEKMEKRLNITISPD
jgi:ATP-dependent DNA helicase RecG